MIPTQNRKEMPDVRPLEFCSGLPGTDRRSQDSPLHLNLEGRGAEISFLCPRVSCPWSGAPLCDCKPLWLLTGSCVCVHQRLPGRALQSGCGLPSLLL